MSAPGTSEVALAFYMGYLVERMEGLFVGFLEFGEQRMVEQLAGQPQLMVNYVIWLRNNAHITNTDPSMPVSYGTRDQNNNFIMQRKQLWDILKRYIFRLAKQNDGGSIRGESGTVTQQIEI